MTSTLYRAYGLVFRSDLALPLPPATEAAAAADLTLVHAPGDADLQAALDVEDSSIVASYEHPDGRWYVVIERDSEYTLVFRDCGQFTFGNDLATIRWTEGGSRADLLPILFAGTALALYFTLRGFLVLHSSAIAHDGAALAFVGQSGRGKSTIAALVAAAGASVVTDDLLVVEGGDVLRCRGSGGELRLRANAAALATESPWLHVSETADQRVSVVSHDVETDWVDVGAIVVPSPSRECAAVEVRKIRPGDAVIQLLAFPRVHGLRPASILAHQFAVTGQVVRQVPVYEVVIPWGPPFRPGIAEALLDLIRRR